METPWANNHKVAGLLRCELVLHGEYAGGINIGDQEQEFLQGSTRPHAAVDYRVSVTAIFAAFLEVCGFGCWLQKVKAAANVAYLPNSCVVLFGYDALHVEYDCDPPNFLPVSEPGS